MPLAAVLGWAALVLSSGWHDASIGWRCILRLSLFSLAPAGAALFMLRQAAPLSPRWTGGLALLAVSSLAMLGTQLVCPKDGPAHLLLWHLAPALLVALAGASLGRRLLAHSFDDRLPMNRSTDSVARPAR